MYYDYNIQVPSNTPESDPLTQMCHITHGVIHRVEVDFPYGCAGLVHLQILQSLHQLWPTNPEGSFNADDFVIGFNDHVEITDAPYVVTLQAWNLDDTFDHTLQVRLGILPATVLLPEKGLAKVLTTLTRRLRL